MLSVFLVLIKYNAVLSVYIKRIELIIFMFSSSLIYTRRYVVLELTSDELYDLPVISIHNMFYILRILVFLNRSAINRDTLLLNCFLQIVLWINMYKRNSI